MENFSMRLREN